jgi:murein DD-endopeptidase MepM/ murein hydrolase activator NlpD
LAFAAVVVSGTAFAVGPANAREAAPAAPPVSTTDLVAVVGPVSGADPVDTFQAMIDEAQRTARVERAVAHKLALTEAAHERARRLAAKVRASRAALRSAVVRPVAGGYHLTARFGDSSSRWGSGRHTGLDFACSVGTPVHAVADGVVVSAAYSGAYGNRIEIRHADGTVTTYNHLSHIEVHGGSVKAGRVIGLVGSTGNTTGAHLHFEVMQGGSYVDPEHWLAARYVSF